MPKANLLTVDEVHSLAAQFEYASPEEILGWAWEQFGERAAIGTSFQGAGLVTIHHAVRAGRNYFQRGLRQFRSNSKQKHLLGRQYDPSPDPDQAQWTSRHGGLVYRVIRVRKIDSGSDPRTPPVQLPDARSRFGWR